MEIRRRKEEGGRRQKNQKYEIAYGKTSCDTFHNICRTYLCKKTGAI
jgi:hypothetical protein